MRSLRAIPLPLAALLVTAAVTASAWALVIPALQGPDEVAHFTYTQLIVEKPSIPWHPQGNTVAADPFTREAGLAGVQAGLLQLAGNLGARPLWTQADVSWWSRQDAAQPHSARSTGGQSSSALKNPPVYYAYEALPYLAGYGGSFFDRQALMRAANIPLLLIALVFVWLLAGELFGRGWEQVLATASAALIPQLMNVTATIDPDVMLAAEWSAALYMMVLILRRGPQRALVATLVALVVLAGFTHARCLPLVLPAAMTIAIAVGRTRGLAWLRPRRVVLALGALYLAVVGVAAGWGGRGNLREFLSYVWQFYLPRLGFMQPKPGPADYGFRQAFVERFYGTLAQLEVVLPHSLATWLFWLTLAGLAALIAALVVQRSAVRRNGEVALVLGAAVIALIIGLHFAAYRALLTTTDPIITGRYLLPLLPLFGAAIVIVVRAVPRVPAAVLSGLVLAGGVALQFVSIGLLWERFYA